jgi:Tol biopolymer transport system component
LYGIFDRRAGKGAKKIIFIKRRKSKMKFSTDFPKVFLISLLIFTQCSSKNESDQKQLVQTDSKGIEKNKAKTGNLAPVVFDCNYFESPKPDSQPELFAPEIFKNEEHQHSSPAFSPDGKEIYWSYAFKVKNTGSRKQVICFSKYENKEWSTPEVVSFSGEYYDGGPFITNDNKKLFFYSDRPITPGAKPKSDHDLWYVERTTSTWGEPVRLEFNTENNETMPSVSDDGTIYFAAQYKGKEGPFNIYYSELKNGKYEPPKSISPLINNDFRMSPYIAADESFIIFATLNAPLHISFKNADGSWAKPVNLGQNINIGRSQRFPMLSPDLKYLFFTSYKSGHEERYWMDAQFLFM